jgi:hypothetical protein
METDCASCEVQTKLKVLPQVACISQLTVSRLSRQCGILNISQPYRPPRPVKGIALLQPFIAMCTHGFLRLKGPGSDGSSACRSRSRVQSRCRDAPVSFRTFQTIPCQHTRHIPHFTAMLLVCLTQPVEATERQQPPS